jgi:hypothetical protein
MRTLPFAVVLLLLAGAAGCARPTDAPPPPVPPADPRPTADPANLVPDGYGGRFQIAATVLENDRHRPSPMNDPAKLVLNVRFVGDLDRHEAEIRQVWSGALRLSAAKHPWWNSPRSSKSP